MRPAPERTAPTTCEPRRRARWRRREASRGPQTFGVRRPAPEPAPVAPPAPPPAPAARSLRPRALLPARRRFRQRARALPRAARAERRERRGAQQPRPAVSGSRAARRCGEAVSAGDRDRSEVREGAQQPRRRADAREPARRGGGGVPRRAGRRSAQRRVAREPRAGAEGRRPRRRRARSAAPRARASIRATPDRTTTSPSSPTRAATRATAIEHYRAFLRFGAVDARRSRRRAVRARLDRRLRRLEAKTVLLRYPFRHGRPEADAEIDDLLREDRTFPPPADFRATAVVRDEQHLRRGRARSRSVLGDASPASSSGRARGTRCSTGSRRTRMVRRRQAQRQRQLPRSPRPRPRAATRPRSSGKASRAIAAR